MRNVYDILNERGYIEQATHEDEIRELLEKEKVTFYIGFDPTADSLHVGHFIQVMVMMHMQQAGHRPIALIGGGTGMVGDPSGKSDMRKMMTPETIKSNSESFKAQFSKFIDFSEGKALMLNNAEWLMPLNYIDFLREIGRHFSVNRMLTAECFKQRLEKGLSFLEFNYMIMQGYDFLELYRRHNCKIQLGGNDQWSNIIAGADLIRRVEAQPAFGLTFSLLTTSEGKKMGKTEKGALWLDRTKTSPYEFYQYWRNVADPDVEKCLALLTFLPMEEVRRLGSLEGQEINKAKEVLAFEVTKLIHSEKDAIDSRDAARALFEGGGAKDNIPTVSIPAKMLEEGVEIITLLKETGLIKSNGEGRRLIGQNGIYIHDDAVPAFDYVVSEKDLKDGALLIRKGKKTYRNVVVE
ncbi:MAG TPA: tyrosine--tRNA ligase [Clostridia bacterium]|nr:tyrosine--tRNA ligase [Clostridia bacterium]